MEKQETDIPDGHIAGGISVFLLLHVLNQVREFGISLDTLYFIGDNLLDLVLDAVVVRINLLLDRKSVV